MPLFEPDSTAVLLGASGAIGCALTQRLVESESFSKIYAIGRTVCQIWPANHASITPIEINDYCEKDIQAAAQRIRSGGNEINLALVATGMLHNADISPEKSLRQIDCNALKHLFTANTIVPIIFAKHFSRLMSKTQPAVLAAISARVGSISDNRLGGWYGYRASKSALNMLYKNLAIEMQRVNPNLIISLLHPGTTDTHLSKPFQANVAPEKLFSPQLSADYLYQVVQGLKKNDTGKFFGWDGKLIEW